MDVIGIVVALAAEGAAFRSAWGLKSLKDTGPFRCYGDDGRVLIVSGTGRVRCASAVSWLIARYPALRDGLLLNAGIAGSRGHEIGSVHLIHQAVDTATGKRLYPDILFSHPYGEATLHTVDRPAHTALEGIADTDLVDMEGAAFLQAAQLFLPCHRTQIIKVVSDNLTPTAVSRGDIPRLMEQALPAAEHIIDAIEKTAAPVNIEERMRAFSEIGERFRLTASQRSQLTQAGRAWLLRHPDREFTMPDTIEIPRDKQSRNQALAVLLARLWED